MLHLLQDLCYNLFCNCGLGISTHHPSSWVGSVAKCTTALLPATEVCGWREHISPDACAGKLSIGCLDCASTEKSAHWVFKLWVVTFLWEGFWRHLKLLPLTTDLHFCCICTASTDLDPELPPPLATMDPYEVFALLAQCHELINKNE